MEDNQIVQLYLARNEAAIGETDKKYGSFCKYIAKNVLTLLEDVEECVNDTFLMAWNRIPPVIPESLKAFLGKITRDLAITKYRANHAAKRYSGMDVMLDELEEILPSTVSVEESIEQSELTDIINKWLATLSADDRAIFIKRYWYGESVKEIAFNYGCTQNNMAQKLFVMRKALKNTLEKKGITV